MLVRVGEAAQGLLGERTRASYAVDEGTFYIRTASRLFKIGTVESR